MSQKKEEILLSLKNLTEDCSSELLNAGQDAQAIDSVRVKYLGRKGLLAEIYKGFGSLSNEDKPVIGQKANEVKQQLELLFSDSIQKPKSHKTGFDLTLPGKSYFTKGAHPFHETMREIVNIFISMGFEIKDGPDVDTVFNNFDALNTDALHPSRSMEDTFYLNENDLLLRTQTSPVQIRTMLEQRPPIKIIAPGRCYRRDTVDATHYFSFHQVEGLLVDKKVTMADLKGCLTAFAKRIMGKNTEIRFRPHFFPFTEPSVEYDFSCFCGGKRECRICHGKGWIEISGAGMVDPNVFKNVAIDPSEYSGYAFGMGVERITLLRHGIEDIRLLYENDPRLLVQF
jgi:phenylalanyl-tRNA synthetase alpha chain